MKEEELIKKLESVELPEIELQSHRRRLRMALLDAGYLQRRPGVTILDLAKSRVKGGIDIMIRGLVSRQAVWKTAVIGVLAVALIAGLAIALPSLIGQSPEALAAEIAQNDPEIQAMFQPWGGLAKVIKVVSPREEDVFHVVLMIPKEDFTSSEQDVSGVIVVNVAERRVVGRQVFEAKGLELPPLSETDKAKAVDIAKADSEVQLILDSEATITSVIPLLEPGYAGVWLRHNKKFWLANVDLVNESVVKIIGVAPET